MAEDSFKNKKENDKNFKLFQILKTIDGTYYVLTLYYYLVSFSLENSDCPFGKNKYEIYDSAFYFLCKNSDHVSTKH